MKAPLQWLKDFVDIELPTALLCEKMIMHGLGVEGVERVYQAQDGIVVGRIERLEPHPNADRLRVCAVNVGKEATVTIVTGAPNVTEGMLCPVALDHSTLPSGKHIVSGEMRGVLSCGMLCSGRELMLDDGDVAGASIDGILPLAPALGDSLGAPVYGALGLDSEVIEFEIAANRADCMSILGIAREIGAALDVPVRVPSFPFTTNQEQASDYVRVTIEDSALCERYTARVFKDIKLGDSPLWMQRRLSAAGMKPISNIVDITNYVMLELGYPLHAFDLACVKNNHIIVRQSKAGETLKTLDGVDRTLTDGMLLITGDNEPIGLAGVMGGENSEITEHTQTVLLEAAHFNNANNRRTSRALGLFSEAAARFTKGIDAQGVALASERTAQLMQELGCATVVGGVVDTQAQAPKPTTIPLNPARINALLGSELSDNDMIDALLREGIDTHLTLHGYQCTIPPYRLDLRLQEDLAEEVARVTGYDTIALSPLTMGGQGGLTRRQQQIKAVRLALCGYGLQESMTMALIGAGDFDAAGYAQADEKRDCVRILNPLGEEYSLVRTTVLPTMINALSLNARNGQGEAALFELSAVHSPKLDAQGLPSEHWVLCVGSLGETFLQLKGTLEALFARFGAPLPTFVPGGGAQYHPARKALLMVGDQVVGEMGELHPDVCGQLDLDKRACVLEINLDTLIENAREHITYSPLPRYPAVTRDLAVTVKEAVAVGPLMDCIKEVGGELCAKVELFDIYRGAQVAEGHKSVAFALTLRAQDRTLKEQEVSALIALILQALQERHGAVLRS